MSFNQLNRRPRLTADTRVLREEEADLSFADFAFADDLKRPYAAPRASGVSDRVANPAQDLVELGGIEPPTLRLPA